MFLDYHNELLMEITSYQQPLTSKMWKWEEHRSQQWRAIPWPALQCPV